MQEQNLHKSFADFPENKKVALFYDAVSVLGELLPTDECYELLRDTFELTDEEILEHSILSENQMMAMGAVVAQPKDSSIQLHHVLRKTNTDINLFIAHEQGDHAVPLDAFLDSEMHDHKHYDAILDAHVKESRVGEHGMELVIDGIPLEQLESFRAAYEKEHTVKPLMSQTM